MMHLNALAIKTQSPTIEVEDSLTAFVKRLGLAGHGRDIRVVKDQLSRLRGHHPSRRDQDDRAFQINTQIVTAFDLWFPKDDRQRVCDRSTVRLSEEYFQSTARHTVPFERRRHRRPVTFGHVPRCLRLVGAFDCTAYPTASRSFVREIPQRINSAVAIRE